MKKVTQLRPENITEDAPIEHKIKTIMKSRDPFAMYIDEDAELFVWIQDELDQIDGNKDNPSNTQHLRTVLTFSKAKIIDDFASWGNTHILREKLIGFGIKNPEKKFQLNELDLNSSKFAMSQVLKLYREVSALEPENKEVRDCMENAFKSLMFYLEMDAQHIPGFTKIYRPLNDTFGLNAFPTEKEVLNVIKRLEETYNNLQGNNKTDGLNAWKECFDFMRRNDLLGKEEVIASKEEQIVEEREEVIPQTGNIIIDSQNDSIKPAGDTGEHGHDAP